MPHRPPLCVPTQPCCPAPPLRNSPLPPKLSALRSSCLPCHPAVSPVTQLSPLPPKLSTLRPEPQLSPLAQLPCRTGSAAPAAVTCWPRPSPQWACDTQPAPTQQEASGRQQAVVRRWVVAGDDKHGQPEWPRLQKAQRFNPPFPTSLPTHPRCPRVPMPPAPF